MKIARFFFLFCVVSSVCFASDTPKQFEESLKARVQFAEDVPPRIGYISLTDRGEAISQSTWIYVKSALTFYKKTRPSCIILELNSPGGEVFAAERISDALKEMDTQYGIPIIAYIDNWAISAGAMLAYSCRYIVVSKDASMGAAEPVYMGQEGKPEAASEKINSALRTDFANRAKYFDRNPYIAEAMVDKDVILVMRKREIIKLDSEEQIRKGEKDPDIIVSPKGKLLTLNAEQMVSYGVADMMLLPKKLKSLSEKEEELGLWPISKSALGQISYFQSIPGLKIENFQVDWQLRFLAFLSSPVVSSILFMALLVAFYMEMSSGGFGVAGAVGLISLFLILLSSFALEIIHWLEPILLLFGILLVSLEFFFFPTLGILGVVGALFVIMGLVGIMVPGIESVSFEDNTLNAAGEYVMTRLAWLSGSLLAAIAVISLLSRSMGPKFAVLKKITLTDEKRSQAAIVGTMAPSPLTELPQIGAEVVVTAALRPAGKVFDGTRDVDALSTGNFIAEGVRVKVVSIEGQKVVVEEIY